MFQINLFCVLGGWGKEESQHFDPEQKQAIFILFDINEGLPA